DARAQSAAITVQAAASSFAQEAAAIETQARQAEQQSRTVLAAAAGMHEQIHDLRVTMQADGEQTGAILNTLLDKTVMGAAEMRDLCAATEMSLTSLGNSTANQAAALTSTMQLVGDRQQTLTVSFDAQRDVISGLLNRLTLAQDETASAAERAAARVGESTQQVVRQLDVIGAQAGTTLASVQASVSGFAEQAGVLNIQGQQAEQQMRGVLSVTSGMQEQARHLREAMQVETARVVEHMTTIIGQLDTANQQLKNESSAAMYSLEQTAQQFNTVASSGAEAIRKQTETLAATADQSEARMANAGEKVRNHIRIVTEVGDKAEVQARQLADSAEFATTRLATLRDSLSNGEKDGREIVEVTSARIGEVRDMLQQELQRLSQLSQEAVAQVTGASGALAAHSDALRANLASSESALASAAELVREESTHIPATIGRSMGEIEAATRALKTYAAEADQQMISTADRFISVTAAARGSMIDELQRVGDVAEQSDKLLRRFHQMLAEQVASMQQSTAMLSSEQKDLVEKAGFSVNALAEASERLSTLRGEATGTAERLAREFDMLDQRAAATGTRLAQAGEGIAKQVDAMAEAASRAENQMSSVSGSFRDQLERIRAGMQTQIDDINRGLMQITAQLERTGASLRSTTVGAVADVERIGQRFEQTSGEAASQIEARTKHMQAATDEVSKLLNGFGSQFDVMLARMAEAGSGIKHHEGDMVTQLQTMLSHLGSVAEKLEAARALSGNVSQHAVEKLDAVVNEIQTQMNSMTTGAQTAAGIMRGIGQIYSDQAGVLSKGVGDAHNQVTSMNKSIDEMQQRTDRMRASLKLQGDELMSSLREILSQLETTGDGLSEAVDRTLKAQAEDNLKKMG
ncbi:MAG: hypothetical protein P4M15_02540, partial [Alphaproteobacteria bacterium]|nr:hypothetical protein [Alphaproteobacteria bacterium]